MEWTQMYIKSLGNMSHNNYALLLKETDGARQLPIIIGELEAYTIQHGTLRLPTLVPLIHDVILDIMRANDMHIVQAQITNFREGIFYGQIICEKAGETFSFPIRVGDAMAIVIRSRIPLFVATSLIEKYGSLPKEPDTPEEKETYTNERTLPKNNLKRYLTGELEKLMNEAIEQEDYELAGEIQDELNRRKKI